MSGVVQFLTRPGTPGPARIGFEGEGGTNAEGGSWRANADVAGGSEAIRYSAGLGGAYSRGIYAVPNDIDSREASLRIDASPSTRFDVTAVGRVIRVDAALPVRDPGATRVPLDPNARNERDRYVATAVARFHPSDRWVHRLRGSVYRQDFVYDDARDDVAASGDYDFFIFDANFRLDSEFRRSTVEYSGSHEVGGESAAATLTWGAVAEREDLDSRTAGDFGDDHQTLGRSSIAGFAEALLTPFAGVDVLAGARVERYEGLDAAFTPRASIVLDLVPGRLSARAAAGHAYKAPNLQEQFLDNPFIESNPDLAPETSTSIEAGLDWRAAEGRLAIGLTAFRQSFDDLIRAVTNDATGRQTNRNLGRSRARGIEWNVRWRPARHWRVGTDGAVIDTEVIDNEGLAADDFPIGQTLPFRPDALGRAWIELLDAGPFSGTLTATYVGEQTVLTERFGGERVAVDPYVLLGADVSWTLTRRIDLYTRLDNLLGIRYETAFDRRGTPFTAALGFRLRATS
jgi:outer membrane receptor protein involved in Fe transport